MKNRLHARTQMKYHSKKVLWNSKAPNMKLPPQGHESVNINSLGCDTFEFESQNKSYLQIVELLLRFIHVLA